MLISNNRPTCKLRLLKLGCELGFSEEIEVRPFERLTEGMSDGIEEGILLGVHECNSEGLLVGLFEGLELGCKLGLSDGLELGCKLDNVDGLAKGEDFGMVENDG
jgi:hypothetical protein